MGREGESICPERILVADDEHLMATGLTTALKALDFAVVGPVSNGIDAIEVAREQGADMALLDIRMPGLDGLAAAQQLWDKHQIPSIIITAYSDEQYLQKAQQTGVFGYLLKPASKENLRVAISIAWARAAEYGEQRERLSELESSLTSRRVIEQAKWKLVEDQGLKEPDAHAHLQRLARNGRKKLVEVAQEVLDGVDCSH